MASEAEKHLERAVHLQASGAWADAIVAFEAALEAEPDLLEAASGLARVREVRGQWSHAAECWARVLEIDPEHAESATSRAECLRQAGCYHLALPAYDTALVLDGEQLYALAGKAETLRMLGRPHEALHWFDRALAVHGEHTFGLRGKAAALNALGRYDEAISYWEHATALDPTSTFAAQGLKEARVGAARPDRIPAPAAASAPQGDDLEAEIDRDWGRALAHDERWIEATDAFRRSLAKRPDRPDVVRDLARACEHAGRWDDAIAAWARLEAHAPDRAEAPAAQGDALRRAERHAESLDAYDRALAIEADHVGAIVGRAEAMRVLGHWDEALKEFDKALERKPTHPVALRGKAAALADLERFDEARPIWRQALAVDPTSEVAQQGLRRCEEVLLATGDSLNDEPTIEVDQSARARARAAYDQGRALLHQSRYAEAAAALRKATEEDPSWTGAWYLLGLCHGEDRQFRQAIRAFDEVLARDPDHVDAACHRGDAMRRNGDYTNAIAAYDAILEHRPDEVRATAGRAEALRMLGRFDEAVEWFDRTLALRPRQYLALCGKAAALNALRRFDEALPLWLSAHRENENASFVKRGLEQCRAALGSGAARGRRAPLRRRAGSDRGEHAGDRGEPAGEREVQGERGDPAGEPVERHTRPPAEEADAATAPVAPERVGAAGPDTRALPVPSGPSPLAVARNNNGRASAGPVPDRQRAQDEVDRGRYFHKERNYPAAIACFENALRLDPGFAEAALRLGMSLEDDKQFRRAIEAYERCLATEPSHYQAATNIGEALRKNDRFDEAVKAYDRALSLRADYLYALAGRAECMRMLGQHQESLAWFDKALAVGPRHAFALQGKAAALNTLQRFKEALPLWEKALEIDPQSPFAKDGKSVCEKHLAEAAEEAVPDSTTPVLDEQGRDLSALARDGRLAPVIGREAEIRSVMKTLVRRLKANPLLLGDPGVGKTAVVEGVAQALVREDAPERLRSLRIIELSMGTLLAGTKYRGTFEERLKDIIKEARENPGLVLFIDEIHTLVGAGRTEGGSLDAANILKPALARGEITVIGATTVAEYRKHFEADSALDRRFQPIHVEEPSIDATIDLLRQVSHLYEAHHAVPIDDGALAACARLSVRFVPDRRLPDKALDLLDESCADASLAGGDVVDAVRVAKVISERTGIPVHHLTEGERDRLGRIEEFLSARVIGQDEAVRELAAAVRLARSGLRHADRPRGVFLFAGSSGVGKTELAKALADFLFPEGQSLVRLDMSEYGDKFTASRLLGAPPGYQGHGEEGQLTGPLRRRPYAVVLLDEFEKAHPDVQTMFLSLFDEGVVTDAEGRKVHAREAFFVLTTNAGSDAGGRGRLGFGGDTAEARRDAVMARARQHFRPELLNRIDGVVVFRDLSDADLERIVELNLHRLKERALEHGVYLTWDPAVVRICAQHDREPGMGARAALRAIDELVAEKVGRTMLDAGGRHRSFHAVVVEGAVQLEPVAPAELTNAPDTVVEEPVR